MRAGISPLWLVVAADSHIGRVRSKNEDSYIAAPLGVVCDGASSGHGDRFDAESRPVLLAVSDGIGGAEAGEVASALVVDSLRGYLSATSSDWSASLREAVERTNRVVSAAGQRPDTRGMGATLTAVCVHGRDAHIAEVGDSRAYLLRGEELKLLTHDQSYVQLLLDAGLLNKEEAERSPLKNVIVQALGQGQGLRVDIGRVQLETNDTLLVCSDGLPNELPADRLRNVLLRSHTPWAACRTLIALANARGGRTTSW